MSEQIEEVEPWIAATDVKEAVELAMSRQCAMFGAWAANCATSRPSSPRGSQAGIDVELPKTAAAALVVVMHLFRAQRRTRMTRLGARRAEDRCPATATTRLRRTAKRGAAQGMLPEEVETLGPGPFRWPVASSLQLNVLDEVKKTRT
jgi:hypothetical protein